MAEKGGDLLIKREFVEDGFCCPMENEPVQEFTGNMFSFQGDPGANPSVECPLPCLITKGNMHDSFIYYWLRRRSSSFVGSIQNDLCIRMKILKPTP